MIRAQSSHNIMQMYQITTVSHTAISGFENIDLPGIHQLVEEDESNYFFF